MILIKTNKKHFRKGLTNNDHFFPHPDELSDPVEVVPSLGVYEAVHIEAGDAEKG